MMPVIRMFVTMPMVVIHNAHRGNILGIFCNKQLKRILAPGPAKFFSLYWSWYTSLSGWKRVTNPNCTFLQFCALYKVLFTPAGRKMRVLFTPGQKSYSPLLARSFFHPCWPEDESFIHPWPGGEKYTRDVGNAFEGLIWSRNFLR